MRLASSLNLLFLLSLCYPGPVRAEVSGLTEDGTRGFSLLTEAAPDRDIGLRVMAGGDYTRQGSLLYSEDNSRQFRRFAGVSIVPWRYLEFSLQYRGLDTHNEFVRPRDVKVRGDSLYSIKAGKDFGPLSFGVLSQARHYVASPGFALSGFGLAEYKMGSWDFAGQFGWIAERPVVVRAAPSPVEAFAWQKPSVNAVAVRLGAAYNNPAWRPYLEYSTEQYASAHATFTEKPHRLTAGAHVQSGLPGLVLSPMIGIGSSDNRRSVFPAEPAWRGGALATYEIPVRQIYNALFPPPGSFVGIITDAVRGAPADNAYALLNGRELPVNKDGRFNYDGPAGVYFLALEAPGYLPATDSVRVEAGQVRIKAYGLRRNAGVVRGIVFLGETPGEAELLIASPGARFLSDAETGAFSFELPPDVYAMTITAPGYFPERRTFVVKLGKEVIFDRLALTARPKKAPVAIEMPPGMTMSSMAPVTAPVTAAPAPVPVPVVEEAPQPAPPPVAAAPEPAPEPEPEVVELPKKKKGKPTEDDIQEMERRNWLPTETTSLPSSLESPVFFNFGSSEVDPRGYAALDRLADMVKNDPAIKRVVIEGRADVIGSERVNWLIASRRGDAVYQYLVGKGVPSEKIATMVTFYRRTAPGQSDAQRAEDRRVGFRLERE